MQNVLVTVYRAMLALGLAIPIISVCLGAVGDLFNIDFDMDGDTGFDPPIPINTTCLFCAMAIAGLIGGYVNKGVGPWESLLASVMCGAPVYLGMYRWVVLPLRKNDSTATKISDMKGQIGTVVVAIQHGGIGKAEFVDKSGSIIGYTVRYNSTDFDTEGKIEVGEAVSVVGIEGNQLVVCLAPSENRQAEKKGEERAC